MDNDKNKKIILVLGILTVIFTIIGGSLAYFSWISSESQKANITFATGVDFPDSKYYDVYKAANGTSINALTACDGGICYGYGLSEVNKWYGDYAYFVDAEDPWFSRGGFSGNGANAGAFNFAHDNVDADVYSSFRSVVSFVGA